MIRDYPYRLMWMFLFVLGITVLYTSNKVGYIESLMISNCCINEALFYLLYISVFVGETMFYL